MLRHDRKTDLHELVVDSTFSEADQAERCHFALLFWRVMYGTLLSFDVYEMYPSLRTVFDFDMQMPLLTLRLNNGTRWRV